MCEYANMRTGDDTHVLRWYPYILYRKQKQRLTKIESFDIL